MKVTHKYHAKACKVDNIRFDSKLEAKVYLRLKAMQDKGEVVFFLRQVPFHLPGGTKLVVDFQVFLSNGTVEFWDAKGMVLDTFKIKKREVEAIYPVEIKVVSK